MLTNYNAGAIVSAPPPTLTRSPLAGLTVCVDSSSPQDGETPEDRARSNGEMAAWEAGLRKVRVPPSASTLALPPLPLPPAPYPHRGSGRYHAGGAC